MVYRCMGSTEQEKVQYIHGMQQERDSALEGVQKRLQVLWEGMAFRTHLIRDVTVRCAILTVCGTARVVIVVLFFL